MKLLLISIILNINYSLSQEYFENENLSASIQALTVTNIKVSDVETYLDYIDKEILRSNESTDGFGTKVFVGTVANGIKKFVNINPYSTYTSPLTDSLVDETKGAYMEYRRQKAVRAFSENINKLPSTGTFSHELIKEILDKSSEIDDFTRADVLQNEAIEKLSELFSNYTKEQIIKEADNIVSKDKLNEIKQDILKLRQQKFKKLSLIKQKTPKNLKDSLLQASKITKIAGQQLSNAASIAKRLGKAKLAKHFNNASSVANVASSIFAVSMGNPLAILPAIDGVLGIFGKKKKGGMDLRWLAEALNEIKSQINELSKQIEINHKKIMEEFEYLRFLNETQLVALTELLKKEIETCANLIPTDWKYNDDSMKKDFVDLTKPLIQTNYKSIKQTWNKGASSWKSCSDTINNFFAANSKIYSAFTINYEVSNIPNAKNIKKSQEIYNKIKTIFQSEKFKKQRLLTKKLFSSPAFWATEYNSENHKKRSKLVTDFAGKFYLNPFSENTSLIDPIILERYVGYLLAVYPLYELTNSNRTSILSLDKLQSRNEIIIEAKPKLKKALALVNLAMSQQLMLSGEGLIVGNDELGTTIKALSDNKFIAYNMGLVLAADQMHSSSERLVYVGSIKANNEIALNEVLNAWKLGKTEGLLKGNNLDPIIKFTDLKKELPLPATKVIEKSADGLSMDGIMLRYSPHISTLLILQEKLMDAIAGFDLKSKRGRLVALSNIFMKGVKK